MNFRKVKYSFGANNKKTIRNMNQINNHKNSTASCSGDGGAGGIRAGGSLQVKCLQPKLQKFQRPDSKQETVKFSSGESDKT